VHPSCAVAGSAALCRRLRSLNADAPSAPDRPPTRARLMAIEHKRNGADRHLLERRLAEQFSDQA
jgi:hypothetical protein